MKTRIFTLSILLLSALTVLAGNKIDKLFDQVKDLPNAEYTHEKISKTEKKGVIDGIKNLEAVEAAIDESTYQTLRKTIVKGDYKPYEMLIDTHDDDEVVKILMKRNKKKITEVVIIDLEKDEINLVRFKGNLKSELLNKTIE
ncbi:MULTISPECIES: DUF4252 domain-containing protein [Barnesiella]|mgnify:FL=1|uniref:DUF4252 domain-containing protein n=1 Tax=Barnesiella TaxID=397864 RepID=UPI000B379072|nr:MULTISPECIES: DUF4252 domain-containing protein [Barnesiella]MCR8911817.1 DUF4252 domain-containing protein [Barnesiella sp. ET7]MDM8268118.1 DUF4252 domain-containing protein [Barnesiella viscericola]OUO99348.1 hypothetical protein B5F38_00560 [Barnesiella sp. An22]HJB73617.1 DUF4252 domain-containing protein [Candidatus Barnesiella merdigallinarum]